MGGVDRPPHAVRGHITYYMSPLNQRLFKGFVSEFPARAWNKIWQARAAYIPLALGIFVYDLTLKIKEDMHRDHLPKFDGEESHH
jgi:hypothetical protein